MHKTNHPFPSQAEALRSDPPFASEAENHPVGPTFGSSAVSLLVDDGGQDIAVLSVRGDIDLSTAPSLRQVLLPILERGPARVIVDLSGVRFMDSTGAYLLIDTHERLTSQNRQLAIACREQGQVHVVLALLGLLDLLPVHGSRRSAVTGGEDLIRSEPAAVQALRRRRSSEWSRESLRAI